VRGRSHDDDMVRKAEPLKPRFPLGVADDCKIYMGSDAVPPHFMLPSSGATLPHGSRPFTISLGSDGGIIYSRVNPSSQ